MQRHGRFISIVIAAGIAVALAPAAASAAPGNVRLTNDTAGGYVSDYTMVTGQPYTDAALNECAIARPAERAVGRHRSAQHPGADRQLQRLLRRVQRRRATPPPDPAGPIWLGYYRSENGGAGFQSSLVPGYPGDTIAIRRSARTSGPPARAIR